MEPEGSNPVSETRKGQLAIVEVANVVRDLTLALNRVYENVRDTQGTKHLNAELPKNFKERVDTFQERRNTIKKVIFLINVNRFLGFSECFTILFSTCY